MMEGVIASPITAENAKSAVNKTPKDDAKGGLPLATPSDSSKSRAKVTPDGPLFTFDAKGDQPAEPLSVALSDTRKAA